MLKVSMNLKEFESFRVYFLNHSGIKLDIINKKKTRRCPNIHKLSNVLLNNLWVKGEIIVGIII